MAAERKKSPSAARESRLADLAREWLADTREANAHDDTDFASGNKERKTTES